MWAFGIVVEDEMGERGVPPPHETVSVEHAASVSPAVIAYLRRIMIEG